MKKSTFLTRFWLSAVGLVLIACLVSPLPIFSQTPIRQQTAADQQQFAKLQQSYQQQLLDYREKERLYFLSEKQYRQLQTLAALDDFIQTAQQLFIARNQALSTYGQILATVLTDTHGLDLSQKKLALLLLTETNRQIDGLNQNQKTPGTKETVAENYQQFNELADDIETVFNYGLGLIKLGRLRNVADQMTAILPKVNERINERNSGYLLAEKQRNLKEISQQLADIQTDIKQLQKNRLNLDGDNPRFNRQNLQILQQDLNKIYNQLIRNQEFINEVLQ